MSSYRLGKIEIMFMFQIILLRDTYRTEFFILNLTSSIYRVIHHQDDLFLSSRRRRTIIYEERTTFIFSCMLSLGVSDLGPQHKEEQMSSKQIKKYQVLVYKETHYG